LKTLQHPEHYQEEIKKSRFIVHASRCDSVEQALHFIDLKRHANANHNCWAYKISQEYRFVDDGEPSSTAGRPIFSAIEGQNLDHVIVLVIRYFGGIKLGAGGLIRAYGGSAARCLQLANCIEIQKKQPFTVFAAFNLISQVHYLCRQYQAGDLIEDYRDEGVVIQFELEQRHIQAFQRELTESSRGQLELKPKGQPNPS